jgi:hypothetical protein
MLRSAARAELRRGIPGLLLIAVTFLALGLHWRVWRPPLESLGGVALLLFAGLGLGIFGRLRRLSWQVRAAAVVGLAASAILLNVLWFHSIDRRNENFSFRRQADDRLVSRYENHHHRIPLQTGAHFVMADFLKQKRIRYIQGPKLEPWRLLALSEASEIVEVSDPGFSLPTARQLTDRYSTRYSVTYSPDWRGGLHHYRMVGIIDGAETAEYFVVLAVDGVDFVIPDSVWKAEGRRQLLPRHEGIRR